MTKRATLGGSNKNDETVVCNIIVGATAGENIVAR